MPSIEAISFTRASFSFVLDANPHTVKVQLNQMVETMNHQTAFREGNKIEELVIIYVL
jgi:hypothetical protein